MSIVDGVLSVKSNLSLTLATESKDGQKVKILKSNYYCNILIYCK